jgi:hypothetical protein
MKPTKAATIAARFTSLLALGWAWLAFCDLHKQLHIHAFQVLNNVSTPYNFPVYISLKFVNVAVPVLLAILLLAIPGGILRLLTPATGKPVSWNADMIACIVGIGIVIFGLGLFHVIDTTMVAVFTLGKYPNWQIEMGVCAAAVAAGPLLCRMALTGRREEW